VNTVTSYLECIKIQYIFVVLNVAAQILLCQKLSEFKEEAVY